MKLQKRKLYRKTSFRGWPKILRPYTQNSLLKRIDRSLNRMHRLLDEMDKETNKLPENNYVRKIQKKL